MKLLVTLVLSLLLLVPRAASAAGQPNGRSASSAPRKIVSLAPSVTEAVFALGFGDRLVGVTTYCDYPPEARRLPKIGGFMSPSLEAITAQHPDLVIGVIGATDPIKAREMERLGLKVKLISLANLTEILGSIRSLADLLGDREAGEKLVSRITSQIENVGRKVQAVPKRTVLVVVGTHPVIAVGGKNFIDELIILAGGANIAANSMQPWLNLPDEYVIAKAPEVIIEAGMGSEREQSMRRWNDLKSIPAVRDHRIYTYASDKILRPGPRVGEALADLARLIHPECFSQSTVSKGNTAIPCERSKS
jgi:iron complex transport system substrate-binding protein